MIRTAVAPIMVLVLGSFHDHRLPIEYIALSVALVALFMSGYAVYKTNVVIREMDDEVDKQLDEVRTLSEKARRVTRKITDA